MIRASGPRGGSPPSRGFTLVELLVVIAIAAVAVQIVMVNLGDMIPRTILDAEGHKLMSNLDWLRSEARLQGKRYRLELDLDNHLWRYVMPAEELLTSEQTIEDTMPEGLGWNRLEPGARYRGVAQSGAPTVQRTGIAAIGFDENGFTADWNVFLTLDYDEDMVWSVQLSGLTGQSRLLTSFDGVEQRPQAAEEFGF